MRPWRPARAIGGWLAVGAMLLLASPGVEAVRAEGDAAAAPVIEHGPVCSADAAPPAPDLDALVARFHEQVKARQPAAPDPTPSASGVVVLNNRGYNYGPPPLIDPALVGGETRRIRP